MCFGRNYARKFLTLHYIQVYVPKKFEDSFFWLTPRQNYIPIKEIFESMNKKSKISKRFIVKEFIRSVFGKNDSSRHDEHSTMVNYEQPLTLIFFFRPTIRSSIGNFGILFGFQIFKWISVFKIKFDFERWTPKRISYQVGNNDKWPVTFFCKTYDLTEEPEDKITIYDKYSQVSSSTNILLSRTVAKSKKSRLCDYIVRSNIIIGF